MAAGMRVLVVRFSSLGDVVLIAPLLRAFRRAHPTATITLATKDQYASAFAADPDVDRLVALEPGERARHYLARLNEGTYDVGLDLHDNLRSTLVRRSVRTAWTVYRKHRWSQRAFVWSGIDRLDAVPPIAERYIAAAAHLGVRPNGAGAGLYASPADTARAREIVAGRYVVLAPGARHRTKRWPAARWRALAHRLGASGLAVVGAGLAEDAAVLPGPLVTPAYHLPLGATIALIRRAAAVVANDSGLMHVAAAVGTPVVAIFGPTHPRLGFAPYRAPHRIVQRAPACRPCSTIGGPRCPAGHHRCMTSIRPEDVVDALGTLV